MLTIRTLFARAAVRLAVAVLPADMGKALTDATRPIWRPNA